MPKKNPKPKTKPSPNAVGLAHDSVIEEPQQHVRLASVFAEALQGTEVGLQDSEEHTCSDREGCATSPL